MLQLHTPAYTPNAVMLSTILPGSKAVSFAVFIEAPLHSTPPVARPTIRGRSHRKPREMRSHMLVLAYLAELEAWWS